MPAACALSSDIAGPTRRCLACDLLHDLSGTRACEVLVIRLKTAEGGIALAPCGHIALERAATSAQAKASTEFAGKPRPCWKITLRPRAARAFP